MAPLTGLVGHYGYLGIAVLVGVEGFGMPAPGQTAIIVGAAYAGHGHVNVFAVAAVAFLAAVIGDSIGFLIGRAGGRSLALRYGRYVGLTADRWRRAETFMGRHGPKVVAIARFVDGMRQLNGVVAGATGMPWRRFVAFNVLGAAAWVGVWATTGRLAGAHFAAIAAAVHRYQRFAIAAAVLAGVGYVLLRRVRRRGRPAEHG